MDERNWCFWKYCIWIRI